MEVRALNPEAVPVEVTIEGLDGEVTVDGPRVRTAIAAMLEAAQWFARGELSLTLAEDIGRLAITVHPFVGVVWGLLLGRVGLTVASRLRRVRA